MVKQTVWEVRYKMIYDAVKGPEGYKKVWIKKRGAALLVKRQTTVTSWTCFTLLRHTIQPGFGLLQL